MARKKTKEETEQEKEERSLAPGQRHEELEPWPGFVGAPFATRFPRLVDELFREWPGTARGRALLPAMDVSDDDKQYTVTVELPGTRKEDVQVELQEGMLTIRGEKKSEREEKKERRCYVERSYGAFSRAFTLPPDADAEHLEASFKDGVLTITIPKTEEASPRTIAIH